jgi:hypothetical protein
MKGSGRDDSIQVVIYMCMEAMLGMSLYSYLYLKLAKIVHLSYYCLCLLFNKIGEEGRTGSAWKRRDWRGEGGSKGGGGGQGGEMAQTVYAHMNKLIKKLEFKKKLKKIKTFDWSKLPLRGKILQWFRTKILESTRPEFKQCYLFVNVGK